jgi:hypothetical protein
MCLSSGSIEPETIRQEGGPPAGGEVPRPRELCDRAARTPSAIGMAGLERHTLVALDEREPVPVAPRARGGGNADHTRSEDNDMHGRLSHSDGSAPLPRLLD